MSDPSFFATTEAAERIADIAKRTRYLLNITPVNADEAFEQFRTSNFSEPPIFHYRGLDFDPEEARKELYAIDLERSRDEIIVEFLSAKREELDRTLTLLEDRDTPRFLFEDMSFHGEVEEDLLEEAERILERELPAPPSAIPVTAEDFAERARAELDSYREAHPELAANVEIRADMTGLMVEYGNLYIGAKSEFRPTRVEPLIQHEVGTHIVTFENGRSQPFALLCVGLTNFDETQEALAVFAEYMVGGLDPARIALLALRVVAARKMSEGLDFVRTFEALRSRGAVPRTAWNTTMRAFRCGGTTKDAIYLRGLARLLDYIAEERSLEPLLMGKLSLEDVGAVETLLQRGVLDPPRLIPRWLEVDGAAHRLTEARRGLRVEDLLRASPAVS